MKKLFILSMLLFMSMHLNATVYYASPTGTDPRGISRSKPGKLRETIWRLKAGDELILLDGQYDFTESLSSGESGTPTANIVIRADEGATPILDFRNQPYGQTGVFLNGDYTHLIGITIRYAGATGIWNIGSHNILERLDVYGNIDQGIKNRDGGYNLIINCDSHDNFDYKHLLPDGSPDYGGGADGFADAQGKEAYPANVYIGCRAWNNSDDGFDFYERKSGEKPTVLINCIAYHNGPDTYDMTNHPRVALDKEWFDKCGETLSAYTNYGNGNGFKIGSNDSKHNIEFYRCVAVGNREKGFDQNGNAGKMKVINCTAYQNYINYAFFYPFPYTLDIHNCISLEPTGGNKKHYNENEAGTITQSHNSWNDGFPVSASDFKSLDVESLIIAPRNADGSLPETQLFRLKESASKLIDKGTDYPASNFEGDEIAKYVEYYGTAPDLGCYEYYPTEVVYALGLSKAIAAGTVIDRDIIKMTYGEAGSPDFKSVWKNAIDDTFIYYTPGNGVNGDQAGGTYYLFAPRKNGLLTVGVKQERRKLLYIEEDGTPLPNYNGIQLDDSQSNTYTFSFMVKAGSTYKLYSSDSKLGFYGFKFNLNAIMANDVTMTYGSDVPELTYTIQSIEGTVDGTPMLSTTATKASPVGTYPITVSLGTVADGNIAYVNGKLTITKAPLIAKAEDVTREQYIENPEFVITYTGWKLDEDESVLTKKPTATTTAMKNSPVGEYEIVVSGGEAQNYDLTYQNGILKVIESTGISEISAERPADIYNMQGYKVRSKATSFEGLPKGLYIVNGRIIVI